MKSGVPWYCLVLNTSSYHGNRERAVSELGALLCGCITSMIVVDTKEMVDSGEYFVFIQGRNAMKKKEEILRMTCVLRIISTGSNAPYVFSDDEVNAFKGSIVKRETSIKFKRGDVVLVRDGCFKNLFGLVTGTRGNLVKVLLKFHVREFVEEIESKHLKLEKSIFDFQPSNIEKKDWFKKFT